jgi:branched-chain amino acid transport system ATP-binding protein
MLLSLKNVKVHYGKAEAIKGINIDVPDGSVTGLIGANGAGKSTIMRAVSGLVPISAGEIWFQNKKIDSMATHEIVRMGIVHVPEHRRLFPYMSVMQNIKTGSYLRKDKDGIKKDLDRILQLFPILGQRHNQRASTLSGGEQQMLAIGRGLMAKPKLLLMDEPSLGLAPLVVQSLVDVIGAINKDGISVLLVEQNAGLAFSVTELLYVLTVGQITLEGKTKELMDNQIVRESFLGG